jgi:membrane fusion protein, heavy metal efflux system
MPHNFRVTMHTPVIEVRPDSSAPLPPAATSKRTARISLCPKTAVRILTALTLVALTALTWHVFGLPLPMFGQSAGVEFAGGDKKISMPPGVTLVRNKPHTIEVPDDVRTVLGIRKSNKDLFAVAAPPAAMHPLVLPGSTAIDPPRLARIRARFAPTRVVEIGQTQDLSATTRKSQFRELRPGDRVVKGQILCVFSSVDVGSKKSDLLDALVQLELDQKILENAEKDRAAVPQVFMLSQIRAVQGDRNSINRALNNLKAWDIPQDEIDALHAEARKMCADEDAWSKTPEGRWVRGEKNPTSGDIGDNEAMNPWSKVTLRAPFDGVIVERNVHVDEMVVDNTVNLFQIADVNRLLVVANCPEEDLPVLEAIGIDDRRWRVQTAGAASADGLPGTIEEIGYLIDPNQHTAVVKGHVENPGRKLRAGQYVSVSVSIPPPAGVVEIPIDALLDDGKQSLVFVQADAARPQYTMRRVDVTHRFRQRVFVRSTPLPKEEQLSVAEKEEGSMPKEPLRAGERVILSGGGELKMALSELELAAGK